MFYFLKKQKTIINSPSTDFHNFLLEKKAKFKEIYYDEKCFGNYRATITLKIL